MPHCVSEIKIIPAWRHQALTSALEPIMVDTLPRVAVTFKCVINERTYGTEFILVNLLHVQNVNLTHEDTYTRIEQPEPRWIAHLVWYDVVTSSGKQSRDSPLSYSTGNLGFIMTSIDTKLKTVLAAKLPAK